MHRSKQRRYSITSSASVSSVEGIIRPSVLAALRLITFASASCFSVEVWLTLARGLWKAKAARRSTPRRWRYPGR